MSTPNPVTKNQTSDFEKLLYKIIVQFSLFNHGLNEQLDPHLELIRKLLKSGFDQKKMQPALLKLSTTLAGMGNAKITKLEEQYRHLFGFLEYSINDKKVLKSIAAIKQRVHDNDFSTPDNLFAALKVVYGNNPLTTTGAANDSSIDHKDFFRSRFNSLINTIDIPPQFNFGVDILKQRTKKKLSDSAYQKVIDDAVKLLLNIKQHSDKGQKDIEHFLSEIYQRINDIETHAESVSESTALSIESHQNFTLDLNAQVENIKNSTSNANELGDLKNNINQYLKEISHRLNEHKQDEETRQHQTHNQLVTMQDKLQRMEEEAAELKSHLKLAHEKAMHDPLTGIPNRLGYNERIKLEEARWKRYNQPLSIIVWDIDHFKAINDNHGHKSGDRTLSLVAQLLINNCRDTDFVARFGGEEFVMLLPNTHSENASILAESIREIISNSGFNANGKAINLTISCGISEFYETDSLESVFERADKALYTAKEQGRNRWIVAPPPI